MAAAATGDREGNCNQRVRSVSAPAKRILCRVIEPVFTARKQLSLRLPGSHALPASSEEAAQRLWRRARHSEMIAHHRHGRCLLLPVLTRLCTCASPTQHPAPSSASSDAGPDASPGGLDPAALAPDDAIAALPALADSAGSAAALALFRRLAARPDLRLLMRLYATAKAAALIAPLS